MNKENVCSSLDSIIEKHNYRCDKGTKHSFLEVYDELFAPRRNVTKQFLEIGISYGDSIRMWQEYFTKADIIGVDIRPACMFQEERIETICGDIKTIPLDFITDKKLDIIIDDGSHILECQIKAFERLSPYMNEGGIYIIEDVKEPHVEPLKELVEDKSKCTVLDRRHIKGRYDDILVIYNF